METTIVTMSKGYQSNQELKAKHALEVDANLLQIWVYSNVVTSSVAYYLDGMFIYIKNYLLLS